MDELRLTFTLDAGPRASLHFFLMILIVASNEVDFLASQALICMNVLSSLYCHDEGIIPEVQQESDGTPPQS